MKQSNIPKIELLIEEIKQEINNKRLAELFTTRPNIKLEVYKKTAIFYALKEYEEKIESTPIIPHGFYTILEEDLENHGMIHTYKKYEKELKLITEVMQMEDNHLRKLLMELKKPNNVDSPEQLAARLELKDILRKFNAKYKEQYVKKIIDKKLELLKEHTTVKKDKTSKHLLPIKAFTKLIMENKQLKETLSAIIYEKLGITITDTQLRELINTTLSSNYQEEVKNILNISTTPYYSKYKDAKTLNRLNQNYLKRINSFYKDQPKDIKELIIEIIKIKNKMQNSQEQKVTYSSKKELQEKLQILYNESDKNGLTLIEEISTIIINTNVEITIDSNDNFVFKSTEVTTDTDKTLGKEYEKLIKNIKTIHDLIYSLYEKQNSTIISLIKKTETPLSINEDNYQINTEPWLTKEKIISIINKVDTEKLDNLCEKHFSLLKKFLIEDGLLWAYIADNIDVNTFSKIINNFESIASIHPEEKINISELHEIIKTANMHDYTNDIIVGLVGQEIATKVINYNQFSGVAVTDEVINKRLRKLIDLSVRSEYINKSSLPYRLNVKLGDYSLQRYMNNDPTIFASGIDTKTCFFISVNENDFFFYSLLNKNGFVLKIVDKNDELVARATCFRKNNVFMINGIRCKNNKIHPENKEEKEELIKIVDLVELFAKKLIVRTKDDECPIDYVVCNKAGILENPFFENRFESINAELFNEPINIYDDDWEEFIHLYDDKEQLLQEVPTCPDKSFTTDFGNHFPALLISSRDNMGLTSPRDISLNDQPATYTRPQKDVEEYIGEEITDEILARINRIRALWCFSGDETTQNTKIYNFKLLKKEDIKSVELGDDWYNLIKSDDTIEIISSRQEDEKYTKNILTKKAQEH